MILKKIEVLIDTNKVAENTKESLAVRLTYEEDVANGKIDISDSEKITGTDIKRTQEKIVHLGDLLKHQADRDEQILQLQRKIAQIEEDKLAEAETIAAIEPELDKAINTIKAINP